ncbi:MAG: TldD/PmbA family protein [Candidatus Cloacimonetes bacterium]|nr:TldD/PmbA family protein [Candidatus Cloacimonadota bacterium]MBS3767409.1 TldD/PmbA family protein [Candidatus Cloacimonadota bacterium]
MIKQDLKKYAKYFKNYTELRLQENRNIHISIVDGDIMGNSSSTSSGLSARVYQSGNWGFASNPVISSRTIKEAIASATKNAKFLQKKEESHQFQLSGNSAESDKDFTTQKKKKTKQELVDFMKTIDAHIDKKYSDISSHALILGLLDMEKNLLTADGSKAYSMVPRANIYAKFSLKKDGKPVELANVMGGFGQFEDNFGNLDEIYQKLAQLYESVKKKAEGVFARSGVFDVILDSKLAGILAHEAIGHTTEADIVRGGSIAGDNLGHKVASELVNLVDFAHHAGDDLCPVPVFVDDEGTKAEDAVLIKNGILKSFMHNKETAKLFDTKPTGNARAYKYSDEALIRMRNTAILPGVSKLDDMVSTIEDGYYLVQPSNGQADSTSEFMFGITEGYQIKNGKIGKAIKDTTISGVAFDMLNTVTMISDDMCWLNAGMCGKKQMIPVGMGGPAIKCKVNIGGK